jgi:hypothetical protein
MKVVSLRWEEKMMNVLDGAVLAGSHVKICSGMRLQYWSLNGAIVALNVNA